MSLTLLLHVITVSISYSWAYTRTIVLRLWTSLIRVGPKPRTMPCVTAPASGGPPCGQLHFACGIKCQVPRARAADLSTLGAMDWTLESAQNNCPTSKNDLQYVHYLGRPWISPWLTTVYIMVNLATTHGHAP